MSAPKVRVHLDKTEVIWIFAIFLLTGGMMFSLGVLVGTGLGGGAAAHGEAAAGEHEEAHEEAAGHKKEKKTAGRAPASQSAENVEPGSGLRKAFRDSKQRALVDLALKESMSGAKPNSVVDNEAHLLAHSEWNRKPANSTDEVDQKDAEFNKALKSEKEREAAGVPGGIKHLFERKPSTKDIFTPKSGGYTVQISSYATIDEAEAKVGALRRAGFNEAYFEQVKVRGGEKWYRVSVGSFPNTEWANKMGQTLKRRALAQDFAVRQIP